MSAFADIEGLPLVVFLKNNQGHTLGRSFHADSDWAHTDLGVLLNGHFHGEPAERKTIVVPLESIDYTVLDAEELDRLRAQGEAEQEANDELNRGPEQLEGPAVVGLDQEGYPTDGSEDR